MIGEGKTYRSQSIDLLNELINDGLLLPELALAGWQGVLNFICCTCKLLREFCLCRIEQCGRLCKRLVFWLSWTADWLGLDAFNIPPFYAFGKCFAFAVL